MSDILLAGKDLPDCLEFAEGLLNSNKVFTCAKKDLDLSPFESEGIYSCQWNRSSAISSRSFIIKAETTMQELDQYVIYFDSMFFASKFELDKTENVSVALDTMFASYQFFVNELLLRLEQKKDPAVVSFVLRSYPSKFETLHSSNKSVNLVPSSNIVNAAQCAFVSLAENISTLVADKPYMSVVLVNCEPANEMYNDEKALGTWVSQTMDSVRKQKSHQSVKQASTWLKPGTKVSTGFSFFR
ncbi:MAG: hypothetical protein SOW31_09970 [Treponema sp.]|nr:hypothetical protein [Treponema sp.]MDD7769041.1 hypothetical protein [Treponema sp.]MDY3132042.1 hypothetical protein [Treponema sp.]